MTPASHRSQLGQVADTAVGGTKIRRHTLEVETERLMNLTRRVGTRLRTWLMRMPEERAAMRYDHETNTHHPLLDADGKQLTEPLLPDKDWIENAEWYSKTMLNLLREQRERAKMGAGKGGPPLTDEEYEAELADLRRAAVLEMPADELRALLAMRPIDVGGSSSPPVQGSDDSPAAPASATEQAGTFPLLTNEEEP